MKSYTWEAACQRRLARQHLLAPAQPAHLAVTVRAAGGIQAQILSAAELAIGARVANVTRRDVRAALWDHHSLVKTYGPRATLHLLPADELPLWMAALRAAETLSGTPWYSRAGLTPSQANALLTAIGEALDGCSLTRKELAEKVTHRVGEWARERLLSAWGEFLAPAALAGKLCFGPAQGSQVTFVRVDQWIGHWKDHDPRTALTELIRRYIATYGPVTHGDVAHWFRLMPAQAQKLLEPLAADLEAVDFAGRRAWMLAADVEADRPPSATPSADSLRLLPQYDCYLLGCGPRERIVPEAARTRVNTYGRGRFEGATALSVMLIDGVVSGLWEKRPHRQASKRDPELRVESFGQLTTRQHELLESEVGRIGAFLETRLALTLGVLGQ